MTVPLARETFRVVLLDIEGTTTPIEFVSEVLFPFARKQIESFLKINGSTEEVRTDLRGMWQQHQADVAQGLGPPPWKGESSDRAMESIIAYVHWLIDRDSKATALKSLQGKIWQAGYRSGELQGQVYPDVPPAFEKWVELGKDICIFSSGSVAAQKQIFESTADGDLTRFIGAYFDTTTGAKREKESYRRIAAELHSAASAIAFISDVVEELEAARAAEMQTVLCVRPGRGQAGDPGHPTIYTFDELF